MFRVPLALAVAAAVVVSAQPAWAHARPVSATPGAGQTASAVRPVSLTDDDGSRDMRFGDEADVKGKAARGDVAAVLADAVEDDEWSGKALVMQSILPDA